MTESMDTSAVWASTADMHLTTVSYSFNYEIICWQNVLFWFVSPSIRQWHTKYQVRQQGAGWIIPISFALHLPLWMILETGMGFLKKEDGLNINKDYTDYFSVIVKPNALLLSVWQYCSLFLICERQFSNQIFAFIWLMDACKIHILSSVFLCCIPST